MSEHDSAYYERQFADRAATDPEAMLGPKWLDPATPGTTEGEPVTTESETTPRAICAHGIDDQHPCEQCGTVFVWPDSPTLRVTRLELDRLRRIEAAARDFMEEWAEL